MSLELCKVRSARVNNTVSQEQNSKETFIEFSVLTYHVPLFYMYVWI